MAGPLGRRTVSSTESLPVSLCLPTNVKQNDHLFVLELYGYNFAPVGVIYVRYHNFFLSTFAVTNGYIFCRTNTTRGGRAPVCSFNLNRVGPSPRFFASQPVGFAPHNLQSLNTAETMGRVMIFHQPRVQPVREGRFQVRPDHALSRSMLLCDKHHTFSCVFKISVVVCTSFSKARQLGALIYLSFFLVIPAVTTHAKSEKIISVFAGKARSLPPWLYVRYPCKKLNMYHCGGKSSTLMPEHFFCINYMQSTRFAQSYTKP